MAIGAAVAVEAVVGDQATDPQWSLFSWAEFMAEETPKSKRPRRQEAPTLSLFEWALEREREGDPVGTGR